LLWGNIVIVIAPATSIVIIIVCVIIISPAITIAIISSAVVIIRTVPIIVRIVAIRSP